MNELQRCQVNLHKQGIENEREDVKLGFCTQRNHYRRLYLTSKGCQGEGGSQERTLQKTILHCRMGNLACTAPSQRNIIWTV